MPTIIVADQHALMREGLILILRDIMGPEVAVAEAATYAELTARLKELPAEIVLVDPDIPGAPGLSIFRDIISRSPGCAVVAVAGRTDRKRVTDALHNGARGFIAKASGAAVLKAAMEAIAAGDVYIPAEIVHDAPVPPGSPPIPSALRVQRRPGLTRRQTEVLDCIRRGLSNREIAGELGMTEGTVKNHVKALLKALNVRNRTQAALTVLHTARSAPAPLVKVPEPVPAGD